MKCLFFSILTLETKTEGGIERERRTRKQEKNEKKEDKRKC